MNAISRTRRSEQGFTLVELAIVMIIIGLLIGGILKGQELIVNARVASTAAQVKGIDAATTTFQDKYNGLPGDLVGAGTRLPALCGANGTTACTAGNGNGRIADTPGAAPTAGGESEQYFQQLNAADLISGINPTLGAVAGGFYAQASIGGGYNVGNAAGGAALTGLAAGANVRGGHYLTLTSNPAAAVTTTTGQGALTPNQLSRIDLKLDDGAPISGNVLVTGAGTCVVAAAGGALVYNDGLDSPDCNGYIRFHQ
jgi:prepilin-type N-terminal cleavage/methylation domain-containing protein